jgi:hypothetical protein
MDGSSRHVDDYLPALEILSISQNTAGNWLGQVRELMTRDILRFRKSASAYPLAVSKAIHRISQVEVSVQAIAPKMQTVWQVGCPAFLTLACKLFPSLPLIAPPEKIQEVDAVQLILGEFESLSREQQDRVAKNLTLLWESYISVFGGVSAFQAASTTERQAYIKKLEAACHRMERAKGTEAAFHYVTVELFRQYISFLQLGSRDRSAVALASVVAPLIDRGHKMPAEPVIYSVRSQGGL